MTRRGSKRKGEKVKDKPKDKKLISAAKVSDVNDEPGADDEGPPSKKRRIRPDSNVETAAGAESKDCDRAHSVKVVTRARMKKATNRPPAKKGRIRDDKTEQAVADNDKKECEPELSIKKIMRARSKGKTNRNAEADANKEETLKLQQEEETNSGAPIKNASHACPCGHKAKSQMSLTTHVFSQHAMEPEVLQKFLTCQCGEQFSSWKKLTLHKKNAHGKVKAPMDCKSCEQTFKNHAAQETHFAKVHKNDKTFLLEVFKCCIQDCPSPLGAKTPSEFQSHFRKVHLSKEILNCPHCDEHFTRADNLRRHISDTHENDKQVIPCPAANCNSTYKSRTALDKHLKEEHPNQNLAKCEWCPKHCSTFLAVKYHQYKCHRTEMKKAVAKTKKTCPICNEVCNNLMNHFINQHEGLRDSKNMCIKCGSKLNSIRSLYGHIKETHAAEETVHRWYFTCNINGCDEYRKTAADLKIHKKTAHTLETPSGQEYRCSTCSHNFISKQSLLVHLQTQHGHSKIDVVKMFKCKQGCGHVAKSLSSALHHKLQHSREMVACEGCGKKRVRARMLSHVATVHTHQPQVLKLYFSCKQEACKKWFKNEKALRSHAATHEPTFNVKTHNCKLCNVNFLTRSRKKLHDLRNHAIPKIVYACSICKTKCKGWIAHLCHNRTSQTKTKKLKAKKCKFCQQEFASQRNLEQHYKSYHPSFAPYKCWFPFCTERRRARVDLRLHVKLDHDWLLKMEATCYGCNAPFTSRAGALEHVARLHKENDGFQRCMLTCSIDGCKEVLDSLVELRIHRIGHGKPGKVALEIDRKGAKTPKFKCNHDDCGVEFKSKGELRRHNNEHDLLASLLQCENCGRHFWGKSFLARHKKSCKETFCKTRIVRPRRCDRPGCHNSYDTRIGMTTHVIKKHLVHGDGFQCRNCGVFFNSRKSLLAHVHQIHGVTSGVVHGQSQHVLKVVGAHEFSRSVALQGKLFCCKICTKTFEWRSCFLAHIKQCQHGGLKISNEHQPDELTCSPCRLQFPCTYSFQQHCIKTHCTTKQYFIEKMEVEGVTGSRSWCSCCTYLPPPSELHLGDPYNDGFTDPAKTTPMVNICLACNFSTYSMSKAFVHVEKHMDEPLEVYPAADSGIIGPQCYERCEPCSKIFLTACDYLMHLQKLHYPKYIEELVRIYSYKEKSTEVINFRKYVGTPGFELNHPNLASKIWNAAWSESNN